MPLFYNLALVDESQWKLSADSAFSPWLENFARILRLDPDANNGNHSSRISFSGETVDNDCSIKAFLKDAGSLTGWHFADPLPIESELMPSICCNLVFSEPLLNSKYLLMWYALFPIYQQSVNKGGLPLHSAMIAHEDRAFVLIGPGNAGKSTSCRLLPSSWKALCDDEVLVVNSVDHTYCVHPFPTWSDLIVRQQYNKSWPVVKAEKLYAIFFLEKSDQNRLIPVPRLDASIKIFKSSYEVYRKFLTLYPPDTKRKMTLSLFDNAVRMAHSIPAFRLSFTIDGGYWKLLERMY